MYVSLPEDISPLITINDHKSSLLTTINICYVSLPEGIYYTILLSMALLINQQT